jgi:hypothetical protein
MEHRLLCDGPSQGWRDIAGESPLANQDGKAIAH